MDTGEIIAAIGSVGVAVVAVVNVYLLVRDRQMNKNMKLSATLANLLLTADRLVQQAERQFNASDTEIQARVAKRLTEVASRGSQKSR